MTDSKISGDHTLWDDTYATPFNESLTVLQDSVSDDNSLDYVYATAVIENVVVPVICVVCILKHRNAKISFIGSQ